MKTLVLVNQKGGVGKSAIATVLAHYLASLGLRVLAVDLDHQANMTKPLTLSGKAVVSSTTADKVLTDAAATVDAGPLVLLPSNSPALLALERQPDRHTEFARNVRGFLRRMSTQFDVVIIDTNPNPDIRVVAALVSATHALSPIQLNQESLDGIRALFNHERVGVARIKERLNPHLEFLGMVPTMVENTPFQRRNMETLMGSSSYRERVMTMGGSDGRGEGGPFAMIPKRSVVAETQASGRYLPEIRNQTAARDAWREIEPVLRRVAHLMGVA
jgi:chromosome partitioning protein